MFRLLSPFVFAARSAILCKLGIVLFQFPHLTFQNFIDIEQASILEYQCLLSPVEERGEGKDGGAKTCRQFRRFSQKVVDHGSETLEVFDETLWIFVLYGETWHFFYCGNVCHVLKDRAANDRVITNWALVCLTQPKREKFESYRSWLKVVSCPDNKKVCTAMW